jgi:hypothetical protein
MGRQLLLKDGRAARYLYCQRVALEPNGKGGVGMAYHGHQAVWGGGRIADGHEGFYGMVTIESRGVQTTENMLIKRYRMRYN